MFERLDRILSAYEAMCRASERAHTASYNHLERMRLREKEVAKEAAELHKQISELRLLLNRQSARADRIEADLAAQRSTPMKGPAQEDK